MRLILMGGLLLFGAANVCQAQDHSAADHAAHGQMVPGTSPASTLYTVEERAAGLREGRGMGLAIPAESNGYPGPRHVLELADQINLTPEQRRRTEALYAEMQTNARRLGSQLLAEEAALDALFRERRATVPALEAATSQMAQTEATLKNTHLRTHLAMMEILSPDQVTRYVELRRAGGGTGRTRPGATQDHRGH